MVSTLSSRVLPKRLERWTNRLVNPKKMRPWKIDRSLFDRRPRKVKFETKDFFATYTVTVLDPAGSGSSLAIIVPVIRDIITVQTSRSTGQTGIRNLFGYIDKKTTIIVYFRLLDRLRLDVLYLVELSKNF